MGESCKDVDEPMNLHEKGIVMFFTVEIEAIALQGMVWPSDEILEKAQELNDQFKQAEDPEERVEIDVEWGEVHFLSQSLE